MATDLRNSSDSSVVSVITGIVSDFEKLIGQQIDMVRAEVTVDWNKGKQAAVPISIGSGFLLIGGVMLSFMFVYLLHWLTTPAVSDTTGFPLWGCYAVVGAFFALVGGITLYAGLRSVQTLSPVPEKSTAAIKENVQWLTNTK